MQWTVEYITTKTDNQYGDEKKPNGEKNMQKTLQRYQDYLCGVHKKQNTIKNKTSAAKLFYEYIKGEITQETIQKWRKHANKHYNRNSFNNRINAINCFLRYLGYKHLQTKHVGFEQTNQIALEEKEINALLKKSEEQPELHLYLLFIFDGVLRPTEIINIKTKNREKDILYLNDTKTGNGHIILSQTLQTAWDKYLTVRPQPKEQDKEYLLINNIKSRQGKRYTSNFIFRQKIRKLAEKCDINKHVTPYTIKRTSITLRLDQYSKYYAGDCKIVQLMARHTELQTTMKYDIKTDNHIRQYLQNTSDNLKPHMIPTDNASDKQNFTSDKHILPLDKSYLYSERDTPQCTINIDEKEDNNTNISFSFFSFERHHGGTDLKGFYPETLSDIYYFSYISSVVSGVLPYITPPPPSNVSVTEKGDAGFGDNAHFGLSSHFDSPTPPLFNSDTQETNILTNSEYTSWVHMDGRCFYFTSLNTIFFFSPFLPSHPSFLFNYQYNNTTYSRYNNDTIQLIKKRVYNMHFVMTMYCIYNFFFYYTFGGLLFG
jgi:site-specific recombinase XerD